MWTPLQLDGTQAVMAHQFKIQNLEFKIFPSFPSPLRGTHKYGYLIVVKTTLEIPDPLFRKAKATAAQEGRSMKDYVVEALREKLESTGKKQGWRSVFGKLSPEAKKAARQVDARIKAADFNKVDPEAWQ